MVAEWQVLGRRHGESSARQGAVEQRSDVPLVAVRGLAHHFDVSAALLDRVLGRAIGRRGRRWLKAVDGIDFEIARGETFALVGESGCGKSTVARCVVGLHTPSAGTVAFDGADISRLEGAEGRARFRRRIQMIFQDPYASLNPRWRVRTIVAEPIRAHGLARERDEITDQVGSLLVKVGLDARDAVKFPHQFSGGQRQRISIARALAAAPEFLVCDEPTSALDVSVQAQILNLMKDLQQTLGLTYLFISHDLAVVFHIADRVGVMYLGRLCEVAETETLFARPRHPYTRLLLAAVPDLANVGAEAGAERAPGLGEVANPIDPPGGCGFHPRCPFADDRCLNERPEPIAVDGGFVACHAHDEGRLPRTPPSAATHWEDPS
ncbi:MAG: ATP-binding cassette domain-containing protein [Alphaproteobacteria bacterium]|nr:ATP-binding cassette domain-containing protein [Alphaproteobacteria bacterium]